MRWPLMTPTLIASSPTRRAIKDRIIRGAGLRRLSKAERLQLFYQALAEAPPASSVDEASALVSATLYRIEDAYSGIPRGDGARDDGRMYPMMPDNRRDVQNRPDLVRDRSKKHNTYYSIAGAICIVSISGVVEFSKPGADGKEIVP